MQQMQFWLGINLFVILCDVKLPFSRFQYFYQGKPKMNGFFSWLNVKGSDDVFFFSW